MRIYTYPAELETLAFKLNSDNEISGLKAYVELPIIVLGQDIPGTWPDYQITSINPDDPEDITVLNRVFQEYTLNHIDNLDDSTTLVFVGHTLPGQSSRATGTLSEELYRWVDYFGCNAMKLEGNKTIFYVEPVLWVHTDLTPKDGTVFYQHDDGRIAIPNDATGTILVSASIRVSSDPESAVVGITKTWIIRLWKEGGGFLNLKRTFTNGLCSQFEFKADGIDPDQYELKDEYFTTVQGYTMRLANPMKFDVYLPL